MLAPCWHPFGIHWHPFRILFLNLFAPVPQRVFLEVPFILAPFWLRVGRLLVPFGSRLVSFWFPLAPFGFLFPPFRGSPWNCNAFSYHALRWLLRHVQAQSARLGTSARSANLVSFWSPLAILFVPFAPRHGIVMRFRIMYVDVCFAMFKLKARGLAKAFALPTWFPFGPHLVIFPLAPRHGIVMGVRIMYLDACFATVKFKTLGYFCFIPFAHRHEIVMHFRIMYLDVCVAACKLKARGWAQVLALSTWFPFGSLRLFCFSLSHLAMEL